MTKVLIVDDEPSVLFSTRLVLAELGYEVVALPDFEDLLPTLHRERPDVILQDVRMPRLDLDALIGTIRSDAVVGKTPVILFSAGMDLEEVAERVGAQAFLEKPFKLDELVSAIKGALPRGAKDPSRLNGRGALT